jgi:hypothetical protein
MKITALPVLFATAVSASVQGFDISGYQPTVDFAGAYAAGARFVMIKVSFSKITYLFSVTILTIIRRLRVQASSPNLSRHNTRVPLTPV